MTAPSICGYCVAYPKIIAARLVGMLKYNVNIFRPTSVIKDCNTNLWRKYIIQKEIVFRMEYI